MSLLDQILPVVTLLIGSGLTYLIQQSESGSSRRIRAGELLADLRPHVWSKDDEEGWMGLQVYLGRLRINLLEARVPELVVVSLRDAAEEFWRQTDFHEYEHVLVITNDAAAQALDAAENRVNLWLRRDWRSRIGQRKLRKEVLGVLQFDLDRKLAERP
ncbi:hypothetical protein GCM10022215_15220 [Nocardioides fonticola]|uniref:Uncharacterized protein n=1 Tax=Nocardioides fonticola TaxID=450363 RepID=A0ABP7XGZ9_9ACTN